MKIMANDHAADVAPIAHFSGDNPQQKQKESTHEPQVAHGGVVDGDNIDEEVWHAWLNVMADWSTQKTKCHNEYIKELVRRGVPANMRATIWKKLANAQITQQTSEQYKESLKNSSTCEKLIQRDITRTFPEHEFFKDEKGPGQERLFNVIKAYSLFDQEVGYCQGIPFIVGILLLQLSEEETYVMVCKIMQDYRMREIYKPTMAELGLCIYQLECMVQDTLPELYRHFQSQSFYTSMYSSSWFLTLFTSCLPLPLAYRVMDLFLSEGLEMIFRLSIAVLQICKSDLLKCDMEGLLKYFQKEMPRRIECEPEYLVQMACDIRYDGKKMKKLCKDYTTLKTKEQEEMVELRKLKTENRLLRQRLETLETESAELADTLIKGQVCRAQEAENNFIMKNQISVLKQLEEEYKKKMIVAETRISELEQLQRQRTINYSEEASNIIQTLQEELVGVKLREAENHEEIKSLKSKIEELEECNRSLRESVPEDPIVQLEEELISVKLREAEANLAMKELRSKITDMQTMWQEHLQQAHSTTGNGCGSCSTSQPNSLEPSSTGSNGNSGCGGSSSLTNSSTTANQLSNQSQPSSLTSVTSSPLKLFSNNIIKRSAATSQANSQKELIEQQHQEINRLKQELLTCKLRDADCSAEIKDSRLRIMELETQNQVHLNQIRRQADELNRTRTEKTNELERQRELINQLKEEQRKLADKHLQEKEDQMMRRIIDIEQTHATAELKQKISSLEAKLQELETTRKVMELGNEPRDNVELQKRMADLQIDMFDLDGQWFKKKNAKNGALESVERNSDTIAGQQNSSSYSDNNNREPKLNKSPAPPIPSTSSTTTAATIIETQNNNLKQSFQESSESKEEALSQNNIVNSHDHEIKTTQTSSGALVDHNISNDSAIVES